MLPAFCSLSRPNLSRRRGISSTIYCQTWRWSLFWRCIGSTSWPAQSARFAATSEEPLQPEDTLTLQRHLILFLSCSIVTIVLLLRRSPPSRCRQFGEDQLPRSKLRAWRPFILTDSAFFRSSRARPGHLRERCISASHGKVRMPLL